MPKKLTYKEVKEYIENFEYTLLSEEYVDNRTKLNIIFLKEHNFKDCKGKRRTLPFDFYLPNHNVCIEYDGTPHYKLGTFKSDLLDLMNRKYLDNIKTKYCKDNNIELIRIPYWEKDNIEKILNHKLITR